MKQDFPDASEEESMVSATKPLVSVVVVVRNEEKNIARCLRSIEMQSMPMEKFEIIVVDGNSTDRTVEVASNFPVKVLRVASETTIGYARNVGIEASRADQVAFIDGDEWADERWLHILLKTLEDPTVSIVQGRIEVLDIGDYYSAFRHHRNAVYHEKLRRKQDLTVGDVGTGNAAFKKKVFDEVGSFDDAFPYPFPEDKELVARALSKGLRARYQYSAVVFHDEDAFGRSLRKTYTISFYLGRIARQKGCMKQPVVFAFFSTILLCLMLVLLASAPELTLWVLAASFFLGLVSLSVTVKSVRVLVGYLTFAPLLLMASILGIVTGYVTCALGLPRRFWLVKGRL